MSWQGELVIHQSFVNFDYISKYPNEPISCFIGFFIICIRRCISEELGIENLMMSYSNYETYESYR